MKGCIYPRGKGTWALVIDLPRDADGKRKQKWHTIKGTKKQAEAELARLLHEPNTGGYVEPTRMTVGQYFERWLADYTDVNCSGKTRQEYRRLIDDHITPRIGSLALTKLQVLHVQSLYTTLLQSGRKDGKGGLSQRTVVHVHAVLHEALEHAVKWQIVARNVADAVEPPTVEQKEMQALDEEQSVRLLTAAEGTRLYLPILLAVCTGLRRGEILALRWIDVDVNAGLLAVRQATEQIRGSLTFEQPKSKKSRRVVALPSIAVEALVRHKGEQAQQRLFLGGAWQDNGLVCCREDGAPWSPAAFGHNFADLVAKADVPHVRFHDLRHSHVSQLLKAGVDLKIISARLGHSSSSFTLDAYAHMLPGVQEEAAWRIDAALRKAMGG